MLHCWQEDPEDRPSFSQLRSSFSAMLQAGSADEYIDLQVNDEAPYYQIKEDEQRERSNSASSGSSEGSISSLDKKKKPKLKRKRTNPYVPTPDQRQQQGGQGERQGVDDEGYIAMQSAEQRPTQLGIPISQLIPSSSSSAQTPGERQLTPIDDDEDIIVDNRTTNPYVTEPSEVADSSLVASSLPLNPTGTNGVHTVRDSSLEPITESTHL